MNKFEGNIIENEKEYVVVESPDIGGTLYITHAVEAPVGSHVKVAIRPEKVMMTTTAPTSKRNMAKGIVKDIGYLGDVSIYHVELESGKIVLATQPNLVRLAERPVTWEDRVYLSWRAENSIVLTS